MMPRPVKRAAPIPPGEYTVARVDGVMRIVEGRYQGLIVQSAWIQKLVADPKVDTIVDRGWTFRVAPTKRPYVPPAIEPLYTKADVIELLEREARAVTADTKAGVARMRRRNEPVHRINGVIGTAFLTAGAYQLFAEQLRTDHVRMPTTTRVAAVPTPKPQKGRKP